MKSVFKKKNSCYYDVTTNPQVVDHDPRVVGEVVEHGDHELEAAVQVTDEQHEADQVEDPHRGHRQVVLQADDLLAGKFGCWRGGHCAGANLLVNWRHISQ